MKSNAQLNYVEIAAVDNYAVGRRDGHYRAYGYEWRGDQDASKEFAHHEVCGRGETPEEAVQVMIRAAIVAGQAGRVGGMDGLTESQALHLENQLLEEIAILREDTLL